MPYFTYKTTCVTTGDYYLGAHSTSRVEDGYLGSGKILHQSIATYGKDAHIREILSFYSTLQEMQKAEADLVTKETLSDPRCMNRRLGGGRSSRHDSNYQRSVSPFVAGTFTPEGYRSFIEGCRKGARNSKGLRKFNQDCRYGTRENGFKGLQHSYDAKRAIGTKNSLKQKGIRNSQYGTFWITNHVSEQKWSDNLGPMPDGYIRGRTSSKDGTSGRVAALAC